MRSKSEGPGDEMVNSGGPLGWGEQQEAAAPPSGTLTPERLAWLRFWIVGRQYANTQTDLLIAKRILDQDDLWH
ncbi:MAG: hypothetical protein WEF86_02790 [Gemmatimonadota bacterium]